MNITLKSIIFKNTVWLALGEGISKILMFFLFVYAARIFGPEDFGIFNFALAFASLFLIFSNFGISEITTRELSKDKGEIKNYPAILLLKILLSLIVFVIIIIVSFLVIYDINIRKIIWILGIYILAHNFLMIVYSFYRAQRKMQFEALIKIVESFLIFIFGFFILFKYPLVINFSLVLLIVSLIMAVFFIIFFSLIIRSVWRSWNFKFWQDFLKISWPLGLAYAFSMVYISIDSVMMGLWGQIIEVGWYSAAYKIAGALIIPSTLISASFFPVLTKLFNESKEEFQRVFKFYLKLSVVLSLIILFFGLIFSSYIVNIVYGLDFIPAVLALQILIVMVSLSYVYVPFFTVLIVSNNQRKILVLSFVGAIINIILNIILIPLYSLYGASLATLITYLVILILAIIFYRKIIN